MHDANDVIEVLAEHGQTGVSGAPHALERSAHCLVVFNGDDVDAWLHDIGRSELAKRENLADHALLVIKQLVGIVDELYDLFFGNLPLSTTECVT